MFLLPSATDQSTCFHQEEIWPSHPYVILMPNVSFARRSSQKSVPHIYNEATHSGAGSKSGALAFSRQSGVKGFTFSQLYQMKCRCCWRCLWWENISHWNWKWVICNAGNLNYQLHVAQHWGVGWVHFIWIGSPMTNTQRHQLSFAEQCNKAIWGQNQRQADALSWEMPAMWHSCPALPRGAPFPDTRVTFA